MTNLVPRPERDKFYTFYKLYIFNNFYILNDSFYVFSELL